MMDSKVCPKYLAVCLFLASAVAGWSQPLSAPQFNCLQVNSTGNPILSWTAPPDPFAEFTSYHIWHASDINGSFTEIISINSIGTTTFTHNITSAQTSDECYYIVAESADGGGNYFSTSSDTLCTISLGVLPSVSPIGFVNIQWTSPYPFSAPVGSVYDVLMEYPAGTWSVIGSFPYGTNSYNYEVSVCQAYLNFQVQVLTPSGCSFISDTEGGNFTDQTPPAIPEVTSVSIDHISGDAVVSWNHSTSPDTQAYIIYSCNGNLVTVIDSTNNPADDQFTDLLAATSSAPVCYLLAAFDYCYSGTPPSPNTSPTGDICNCSVFLYPIPYAVCNDYVNLSWTSYTGWSAGVDHYNIYHSFGGAAFSQVGQVSGTENTFTHSFTSIESGMHDYYIEAVAATSGYTASSNLQTVNIVYPTAPQYNYLSSASVTGPSEITITLQTEVVNTGHNYILQRYRVFNGTWDDVTEFTYQGQPTIVFTDEEVTPSAFSYTYRIVLKNLCNQPAGTSNIGKTMVLSGISDQDRQVNMLQWYGYEGWENGVDSYEIHRKIGTNGADELIAVVNAPTGFYEDDASDLLYTEGNFCYYIKAVENPSSLFPSTAFEALSNEICLVLEPKIWVPNAFVVDGFNSSFKPVISFADFSSFRMYIYSRWGDVIYQTNDIDAPWTGRMNGKLVQEGPYAYFISVEDGNGRPYEVSGLVIMLSARDQ
ncbi:MAG: gliding motility-associated C-terminal domain-containing protein [Crocinitomicaceae bacterium]|nr:gliding motility-associated C-terminal domain-containing protein [Crocinitomicaceae bacterium]